MVTFTMLLRRRPGTTHEEFIRYHQDNHAPLFVSGAAVRDNVRRYVQQHTFGVTVPGLPEPDYDGVTELWFDDVDGIGKVFADAEYLAVIRPDEATFCDMDNGGFMITTENVVLPAA